MIEISKENIGGLNDEQLFKVMKSYGLNVGPITSTTRHLYEKKLRNYLDNNMSTNVTTLTAASDLQNESMNTSNLNDISVQKSSLRSANKSSAKAENSSQNKTQSSSNQKNLSASNVNSSRSENVEKPTYSRENSISTSSSSENNKRPLNQIRNVTEKVTSSPLAQVPSTTTVRNEETSRTTSTTARREEITPIDRQYTSITRQELNNPSVRSNAFNFSENRGPSMSNSSASSVTRALSNTSTVTSQLVAPSLSRGMPVSSYSQPTTSSITFSSSVPSSHQTEPIRSSISVVPNTINNSYRRASPVKDKFGERLQNYGLIRNEPETLTATTLPNTIASPTNIRSRPPLHYESLTSTSKTQSNKINDKSQVKQENISNSNSSILYLLFLIIENIFFQMFIFKVFAVNWKYLIAIVCLTVVVYTFMMQLQPNPENPIDL